MSPHLAYRRLGEMLVERGLLSEAQLNEALAWRGTTNRRFGEVLIELGFVREEHVTSALATQFCHETVDLGVTKPDAMVLRMVTPEFALDRLVLPLELTPTSLKVAIADPLDVPTIDDLKAIVGGPITFVLASPTPLRKAILTAYGLVAKAPPAPRKAKPQKDRKLILQLYQAAESVTKEAA